MLIAGADGQALVRRGAMGTHISLLEGIPLFAALTGDEKWDLARRLRVKEVAARQTLFWMGDEGDDFYVVSTGEVEILYPDGEGKEVHLALLGPGDFLGEVSLLDGGRRTATARAQTNATLLCLGREPFQNFLRETPSAALHVINILGKRQRESLDKLRGIRNLNDIMEEQLTPWQRIAHGIASMASSHYFLMTHAAVFAFWIILNLSLRAKAPDPFPFQFLCFWTSCEAIFLSMFIMISQSLQGQKDRLRTQLEYQVAVKAQLEIMDLHRKMDELPAAVLARVREEIREGDRDDTAERAASTTP